MFSVTFNKSKILLRSNPKPRKLVTKFSQSQSQAGRLCSSPRERDASLYKFQRSFNEPETWLHWTKKITRKYCQRYIPFFTIEWELRKSPCSKSLITTYCGLVPDSRIRSPLRVSVSLNLARLLVRSFARLPDHGKIHVACLLFQDSQSGRQLWVTATHRSSDDWCNSAAAVALSLSSADLTLNSDNLLPYMESRKKLAAKSPSPKCTN